MNELISYEVKVSIYGIIIILVSIFIFTKKKELDNSYFAKYYIYYYIILVANLLNMIFVTLFYHYKIKDIVGLSGKKGEVGNKGDRGIKVSCLDSNLNIKKTKMYREIVILDVGEKLEALKPDYNNFKEYIENGEKYFNLDFLNELKNKSKNTIDKTLDDKIVKIINKIFEKETRMDILFNYLNKRITNDKRNKQNRIGFYRPIGGNGFFPIGHSVFDVTDNEEDDLQVKMNAFIITGDIRFPKNNEYDIKLNFSNKDRLERQDKKKESFKSNNTSNNTLGTEVFEERMYSIIHKDKMIKPNAEGEDETYVPMGELIVRNDNVDTDTDTSFTKYKAKINLMGFINCKCARKIELDELELVAVKMSFKEENSIRKFFKSDKGEKTELGLFSIWKTPMNTFVSHCIKDKDDLHNNKSLGYNILDGAKYNTTQDNCPGEKTKEIERQLSYRENLSNDEKYEYKKKKEEEYKKKKEYNRFLKDDYLTQEGIKYVEPILKAINIPILVRICYVTIHQHIIYFEELKNNIPKIIENIKDIIFENNNKLERATSVMKKKINEENKIYIKKIKRLNKLIKLLKTEEKKPHDKYGSFTKLFDGDGTNNNNNNNNVDNIQPLLKELIPDYDKIQEKLEMIPSIIEEKKTLYDILILLFPNGFDTTIDISNINFIQEEILNICKICFPPNTSIYIPRNECISYSSIDLYRRKLMRKFNKTLDRYNFLRTTYEFDISKENYESHCDSREKTDKIILELEMNLEGNFGHIKNYKKLIEIKNMNLFSNIRIEYIIKEYEKIIKHFESTCNEVEFKDYFDQ